MKTPVLSSISRPKYPRSGFRLKACRHLSSVTAVCGTFALVGAVQAATDVWNNSTTLWETSTAWTPAGPPTATDTASFDPTVAGTSVMNPTINSASDVAAALNLNNNFFGGTYSFGGTGTLTLGSGGITTRGFGTQTFNGPILAGAATGNLAFNIGTDSGLTLTGATTATTNAGAANLDGGTLTLDNSGNATLHLSTASIPSLVGGTLSVVGNSAGTAYTLGAASFNAGSNTISVNAANGATSVNFANAAGSLRTQTYMAEQFVSGSGALGTAAGGLITFTGVPNTSTTIVGANGGALSNNTTTTVGFATVRDANGTNYATYVTPSGGTGGIVAITPSSTVTDATGLASLSANSVAQFNPAAGTTVTPSASVASGLLRITPAGSGSTLALGANNLTGVALMLDGANNYTISGTGTFGSSGTRYIYVNNAGTSLTTSINIASGANPSDIVGPGFVVLSGVASQNTLTTTNRLNLIGGVLRGNSTQIGFGTTGGAGVISLRGGVLEITGGTNSATGDFARPLVTTNTAGGVNWSNNTTTDQGSGGFSAFGSNASVNLGGASAGVTWGAGGFVNDGYALRFGSTQSNAVLTFQNSIGLDAGTAGAYAAREINVALGTGGDGTVLSGVVSGSASSDLLKTGAGALTLSAANTYSGRTFVQGGTLVVGATGSINNSPRVQVTAGALTLNNATALSDTGTLSLTSGTTLNLSAGAGTSETVAALVLDGTSEPAGTYNVTQLSSFNANIIFNSASGETLTIVPVPEPTTILGGLLLVVGLGWRKRQQLAGFLLS